MKYKKKPVVIEAAQMAEDGEIEDALHSIVIPYKAGDWVITGIKGEQYPCKDEVFRMTYEPVVEP